MKFPKDYILPHGTPFTLCLRVERVPHRITKYRIRARLADEQGHTLNAHIVNGNNHMTKRDGLWTMSEHKNFDRANAKAQWIAKAPMAELLHMRRIVYGEERIDDLWDDWRSGMVRDVDWKP